MTHEDQVKQIELEILRLKMSTARNKMVTSQLNMLPSARLPVGVIREGSRWMCILADHPELLECVVAYGDSPQQATMNFDSLWLGTAMDVKDSYDEDLENLEDYGEEY